MKSALLGIQERQLSEYVINVPVPKLQSHDMGEHNLNHLHLARSPASHSCELLPGV